MLKIHKFEPRHLASKRTLPWSCHRSLCEADYLAKWKCHLIERWNWEDHPTMAQGGLTFQGKMTPWWAWVFRVPGFISGRCWQPHSQIKPGEICCRIHRFSETWSQYHQTKGTHISCFNWDGSWNSTADHYFPQILAGSEPATVIHKSRQHQTWFWLDNFWIRLQGCPNFGVFLLVAGKINYDFLLWVGSWVSTNFCRKVMAGQFTVPKKPRFLVMRPWTKRHERRGLCIL